MCSRLEAGWTALQAGRWDEARAAFEAANEARESAEATEGLSWAAWWVDDADTALKARESAFRLYREVGDVSSAARMAAWIAADEVDFRGAVATARGWLARGRRLLEPLEPGPDHGWLYFHEGYVANLQGDTDTALELSAHTARLGRQFGVPDLEMLGLSLEGAILVSQGKVEDGMVRLDEASAIAMTGEALVPMSSAWTCCFLVGACTQVLDYDRAFEWCDRIAEFAQRYGSRYMLGFCRAEYAAVHIWRGRWDQAERELEESIDAFSRARPAMVGWPLVELAELQRRCGRPECAIGLLERAGGSDKATLVRARLALDQGDAAQAIDLADRVLRNVPTKRVFSRVAPLEILVRARAAKTDLEAAQEALALLRDVATLADTTGMNARVRALAGLIAAAQDDHAAAKTSLEDAVDAFERCGAPFDASRARLDLAASLRALGREDLAQREEARASSVLTELAASVSGPAAQTSPGAGTDRLDGITTREREVLACIARGCTNREISARLQISEHTVHRHVTNILRKLGLSSRAAAAAQAVRAGLLDANAEP